jgi:hypothetical protein
MEQNNTKGIYLYAMEYAIYMGLLLILKMILSSFSGSFSIIMGFIMLLLVVAVPVVGYVLTKRFRDESGYCSFSKIFLFGVMFYFFASLISGIFDYVYYQYINPEFFQQQLSDIDILMQQMVEVGYISDPDMVAQLEAEKPHSPIAMVYQGMFGMIMIGTAYSLLLAIFLRKKKQKVE